MPPHLIILNKSTKLKLDHSFVVLHNSKNNNNNPEYRLAQQGKPQGGFAHNVGRIRGCFSVRGAVATGGCGLDVVR